MRNKHSLRPLLALFLALCCLPLAACGARAAPAAVSEGVYDGLEVTVLDAGKADAILLTTPDSAVLIDCGEKSFGPTLLAALETRGIERLDLLILTHFDRDHVGGAARVIGAVEIGRVLQSNCPKDSGDYRRYLRAVEKASLTPETLRESVSFTLGGVRYTVDPPLQERYDKDESNNSSLIVTVEYGERRLLFMGDAETARIAEFLAASPPPCDVIKLPHHGEKEKLLDALLAALRPSFAVITCSADQPEAASTVSALAAAGVESFPTRLGAVRIRTDGSALSVEYVD